MDSMAVSYCCVTFKGAGTLEQPLPKHKNLFRGYDEQGTIAYFKIFFQTSKALTAKRSHYSQNPL